MVQPGLRYDDVSVEGQVQGVAVVLVRGRYVGGRLRCLLGACVWLAHPSSVVAELGSGEVVHINGCALLFPHVRDRSSIWS